MDSELVLVVDFGGQYNQLIARRVREMKIYCEILPFDTPLTTIKEKKPKGIIFTGGPNVAGEKDAPTVDAGIFELNVPVLGICYGCQLMGHLLGAPLTKASLKEYGHTNVIVHNEHKLFEGLPKETSCWMSHAYYLENVPKGFSVIAKTDTCPVAAMGNDAKKLYGLQFHPEVGHTPLGQKILENFLLNICQLKGNWEMKNFTQKAIEEIKNKIGNKKALCALSGGVDSSVAAIMVHKAIGDNLTCIFVDHGLMRKNEGDEVENIFKENFKMNVIRVNAQERFLQKLKGIADPETKRKIIGEEFIRIFEEEAKKIDAVDFLVQGTIYPDVIESGNKNAAVIKSHHNVGGLPDVVEFKEIIEPLKDLFKDEVREAGLALGLPSFLVFRQPFPGPGLAIRVIGEVTLEKLSILREADFIFREEIKNANLDRDIWQYFAILTGIKSVGVMGDERTYNYTIALRGVTSSDAMTADWARIPLNVLAKVSNRIVNEVAGVNRIVYDITSKPPSTIEWE